MATKAPDGKDIQEYPKMIYPEKIIVNDEKEEAKLLAKREGGEVQEKSKSEGKGKPAGWDK